MNIFEVNEDNYHKFLTYHGHDPWVAKKVVEKYDNPESRKLGSVRLWVDASKIALKKAGVYDE
jgi:hypothetical protein